MKFALTYHIEGPRSRASAEVYDEVSRQVVLADELGFDYAWFAEHHAHVHLGHLPCPLLLALHLSTKTKRIHLGTAVICLNMHDAIDVAEQVAVADLLAGGRIAPGFGSGSTPEELALYGRDGCDDATRHAQFEQALGVILEVWSGAGPARPAGSVPDHGAPLPVARADLSSRTWIAANSTEAASIAGRGGHSVLFSYLRTPAEYATFRAAYLAAGGRGSVAANRPVYVAVDDASAWREAQPALRTLWRRYVGEGKIPKDRPEPTQFNAENVPAHFLVGGPQTIARAVLDLRARVPFDTFNIEPRWAGLTEEQVHASLRLVATQVRPAIEATEDAAS